MIQKLFTGAMLLMSLSFCAAAAPAAEHSAKKPYHTVRRSSGQKNHRLARAVKAGMRHRVVVAGRKSAHSRSASGVIASRAASRTTVCWTGDAATIALSNEFRRQKGHLGWPVAGTVSASFGPQKYAGEIYHNNLGTTIDCAEGADVRAVYSGEVTSVTDIAGVLCVILQHGSYYTAYSNLVTTTVVKGDQVQAGEPLGRIAAIGQLEFMLSDEGGHFTTRSSG
ncbi:murein hydrolase activator EnvC family protein [Puia sp. P3]|uniref:murein hydrolase activator EnvC family protein n=1 Tax=Puia sp. P3 TaxID=3423952 RepID=UPI003D66C783